MSDGSYRTHVDVTHLSPPQRQHLDGQLRAEGIDAQWAGNQLHVDQAFEARVDSLVADAARTPGGMPGPVPGPPPGAVPAPLPPPGPSGYPYPAVGPTYAVGYPGTFVTPTTNSNAVIALVLGIASYVVCGFCCIPAIILGRKAEQEIADSQGTQGGAALARAGWILGAIYAGILGLALVVIIVALVVAALTGSSAR